MGTEMVTYISILRGINVSGKNLIKMDALRKSYEQLGYRQVTTYVQSGNIVFKAERAETGDLAQSIAGQITKDFGLEVPVQVLNLEKLRTIMEGNPFQNDPNKEASHLHVTFLASAPQDDQIELIESKRQEGELIDFSADAVYLYCPNGYGRTKLTNNFLESKLKVSATTRNWKTVNALLKIGEEVEVLVE